MGIDDKNDLLSDEVLDRMMGSTSKTLALDIPVQYAAGVRDNLRALLAVGLTLVEADKPASPVVEIAPVYRP